MLVKGERVLDEG